MRQMIAFALCVISVFTSAVAAGGDVTTNPSRLVLSNNIRAGEISVHNSGTHTLSIHSSWTGIRQDGDGVLHPVPQPHAPDKTFGLHKWPQDFTLKPGETRPIVLVLDPKTAILEEQRTHLRIDADRENGRGPRWGVTLPIFMRPDGLAMRAKIVDVRWASENSVLVHLIRKDGSTPYGKIQITDTAGTTLGELGNISLYANDQVVRYEIQIDNPVTTEITVRYIGAGEFENQVFDSKSLSGNTY